MKLSEGGRNSQMRRIHTHTHIFMARGQECPTYTGVEKYFPIIVFFTVILNSFRSSQKFIPGKYSLINTKQSSDDFVY